MKSLKLIATVLSVTAVVGCGNKSSSSTVAPAAQKEKSFSERIQFAKAYVDVDGIELSLALEGTKTIPSASAENTDSETPDVVNLQIGKDGHLEAVPAHGMDIRGEGRCENSSCTSSTVSLHVNETGFASGDASLEITASRFASCKVTSVAAVEDELTIALKDSIKGKLVLSVVENRDAAATYVSISKMGTDATKPFLRTNLAPSSRMSLDLVTRDASGSISRSAIEAKVVSAQLVKAPFGLSMQLSYKGQPSTDVVCKF